MTSPTRQQIIDAYTAVTTLARLAEEFTPVRVEEHKEINDLHLAVRAALPTLPRPTMADVEWDDDKHYLAEAESESGVKVVMLSQNDDFIRCIQPPNAGDVVIGVPSEDLTPTGRRYTPTEVQE
ncbi:hypothetical protein ABRP63_11215 [Corynebacterium sp. KPL2623]|uniref:hypothetical protein n=1 Tax=Corynebacterium sp. KPL2623 TaxID=3158308 RepID=UPI0032ECCD56